MNQPLGSSGKKQPTQAYNDSLMESLRGLSGGIRKSVTHDVIGNISNDVMMSFFGKTPKSGDLQPNEPINLPDKQRQPERMPVNPFLRRPEVRMYAPVPKEDQVKLKQEIDAVRMELKALASSIKTLHTEVEKSINEIPVNPGIYHANFFDRLKIVLKSIRQQIDDSSSWLSVSSGRKNKKQYWGMYKKHGTSFGLSSERTLATQTG